MIAGFGITACSIFSRQIFFFLAVTNSDFERIALKLYFSPSNRGN